MGVRRNFKERGHAEAAGGAVCMDSLDRPGPGGVRTVSPIGYDGVVRVAGSARGGDCGGP